MKTITKNQLIDKLKSVRGATPISLLTLSDARLRKTGNPFSKVLRESNLQAFIGVNYENSVNRQGVREENENAGQFVAAPLAWGEREEGSNSPIIVKGDKVYLQCKIEKSNGSRYVLEGGEEIAKDLISAFLPTPSTSKRQEEFGAEKEVIIRTYSIDSIKQISIQGEKLIVI